MLRVTGTGNFETESRNIFDRIFEVPDLYIASSAAKRGSLMEVRAVPIYDMRVIEHIEYATPLSPSLAESKSYSAYRGAPNRKS